MVAKIVRSDVSEIEMALQVEFEVLMAVSMTTRLHGTTTQETDIFMALQVFIKFHKNRFICSQVVLCVYTDGWNNFNRHSACCECP